MLASVPTSAISASLVAYLRTHGRTLRQIGDMIGLSESFVSRVARGERSFTLDHLSAFEQELGEPLPALLLQSMKPRSPSPREKAAFDEALQLLREIGEFRYSLVRGTDTEPVPPAKRGRRRARVHNEESRDLKSAPKARVRLSINPGPPDSRAPNHRR